MTLRNEILIPELARLIKEGHQVQFTPSGESMRPFIEGGRDSVTLTKADTPKVGDIVLAEVAPQHFVLHRIIRLKNEHITLMGDGNLRGEEHCTTNNLLGKVIAIHSPKGHRKPLTRALLWRHLIHTRRLWLKIYRHLLPIVIHN